MSLQNPNNHVEIFLKTMKPISFIYTSKFEEKRCKIFYVHKSSKTGSIEKRQKKLGETRGQQMKPVHQGWLWNTRISNRPTDRFLSANI